MKNKKILLIAITATILIIFILVFIFIKNKPKVIEEGIINEEKIKSNFVELFDNQTNEYVGILYDIEEEKSGEYNIKVHVPYINIEEEINNIVNKEINDIFINKLIQIIEKSEVYTIFTIDYSTSINNNILSLMIRCVLKEGTNAQRTIIKTYNYDVQNQKLISIMDLVSEEESKKLQNKIYETIDEKIEKENIIIKQGYNVYRRDKESLIYNIENATEIYLRDNILYIIYCYGNSNYTSEVDLIISNI